MRGWWESFSKSSRMDCAVNGLCSWKHPQTGGDGYPQYLRQSPADDGFTVTINEVELVTHCVVPYNPVLSYTVLPMVMLNSVTLKTVKIFISMSTKGLTKQCSLLRKSWMSAKVVRWHYVSGPEAVWFILYFSIHNSFLLSCTMLSTLRMAKEFHRMAQKFHRRKWNWSAVLWKLQSSLIYTKSMPSQEQFSVMKFCHTI